MPSASPSVSIVTLNWNGLAYLPACLAALGAQTYRNFELLIVENGSTDGSVDYLTDPTQFARLGFAPGQVRVLPSPTNLGFSGGNNLAFAEANGNYIATINNDTIANPDWLAQMVAALAHSPLPPGGAGGGSGLRDSPLPVGGAGGGLGLRDSPLPVGGAGGGLGLRDSHPLPASPGGGGDDAQPRSNLNSALSTQHSALGEVGMVAATLLFTSRPDTIAAAGLELRRDGLALERLAGRPYRPGIAPYEIFGPTAGAALYSRRLLTELGGFDARYFAYLEDVDLAWRARLQGWRCLYAPAAAVLHHYSATGVQGSPFKSYHLARNRIWTIAKNLPTSLLRQWLPYILRYEAMAVAYGLLKRDPALLRGRRDALRGLSPILASRRAIQRTRIISDAELAGWFRPPITVREMLAQRRMVDELAEAMRLVSSNVYESAPAKDGALFLLYQLVLVTL